MKKHLFLLVMMLLPMVANAHDIEVQNGDGVTIYYNYINNNTELEVTFRGSQYKSFSNGYTGNVVIPNEVTYMNRTCKVTSIGKNVFSECSGLTSINVPNSVTSIGKKAFEGCSGLQKVIVSDIAAWCGITFNDGYANPLYYAKHLYSDENTEIKDLVIPNSLTSISDYAFFGCSGLSSVSIPNSMTSLGDCAFAGCSGLTSVSIPNSVTNIGRFAFSDCSGLTSVSIPNSMTSISYYAFSGCSGLTSVSIPNSMTSIGDGAFSGCSGLNSITIPCNVTIIGNHAFFGCSSLNSVTIPNSVTDIGYNAFSNCSSLTSITIPNSVTNINEAAFAGCSGLTKVIASDIAAWCRIKFGDSSANPLYFAKHLYSDENTEIMDLVIPNIVGSIGNRAFYGCSGLNSVTIPNSVTDIGYYAFDGCSGLQKVIVSDIAAWCAIKFYDYGANPLYCAKHLYSDENTEIKDLVIPNGVTDIGYNAFYGCSGLNSVTIPNSVTKIGGSAFYGCSGLTSATIPNSVTSIGNWAFSSCTGLTSITIGNSVTSIGVYAFDEVDLLTVISLIENPRTIGGKTSDYRTFSLNTFNNAKLYVPMGTIDKYNATEGWSDFVNIVEGVPAGIIVVENTKHNNAAIYNLNGVRLSEPKKGINIINGKKVAIK